MRMHAGAGNDGIGVWQQSGQHSGALSGPREQGSTLRYMNDLHQYVVSLEAGVMEVYCSVMFWYDAVAGREWELNFGHNTASRIASAFIGAWFHYGN